MAREKDAPSPEDLGLPKVDVVEVEEKEPEQTDAIGPEPKKRRGRPPGSGANSNANSAKPKKSNARKAETNESLAQQLIGIHQLAFLATGIPECAISEKEALMVASALNSVAEEYGLAINGKTGAAIQLFGAAAIVYGPRLLSVKARMAKVQAAKKAEQNRTVDMGHVVTANHDATNH